MQAQDPSHGTHWKWWLLSKFVDISVQRLPGRSSYEWAKSQVTLDGPTSREYSPLRECQERDAPRRARRASPVHGQPSAKGRERWRVRLAAAALCECLTDGRHSGLEICRREIRGGRRSRIRYHGATISCQLWRSAIVSSFIDDEFNSNCNRRPTKPHVFWIGRFLQSATALQLAARGHTHRESRLGRTEWAVRASRVPGIEKRGGCSCGQTRERTGAVRDDF